jgi:phenazine biosynthesis protein phzE
LKNKKEENELAQVIDEELKMMAKISNSGYIVGPKLREVGQVIHTEADLIGKRKYTLSMIDMLRDTLYSPTLVG